MIRAATVSSPEYIADFAAGDGALLAAAADRWPSSRIIAIDVDRENVVWLKRNRRWRVGRCNFLSDRSRSRCQVLAGIEGKVSLVLLNPPFSCRGATRVPVEFDGESLTCSKALAFVLASMGYLTTGGELIAVLPAGSIMSEKDRHSWEMIKRIARCEIVAEYPRGAFAGCTARTVVVRVTLGEPGPHGKEPPAFRRNAPGVAVRIMRGSLQMHSADWTDSAEALPLIHSTELGTTIRAGGRVRNQGRVLKGPAVLLPRVGKPDVKKLTLYMMGNRILLSDCVVALQCRTKAEARTVYDVLRKRWQTLEKAYGGTCARYIALRRLAEALKAMGIEADYEQAKKVARE